MDISQVN